MDLAVVTATQRDSELVTDLFAERAALGEAEVMGIAGDASANEAWMLGHVSEVGPVTDPARLGKRQHALVDAIFHARCFLVRRFHGNRLPPLPRMILGWDAR